jgi:hypothetical protein
MNLTIFPVGGEVIKDKVRKSGLIWEGTPDNVNALQWFGESGWIEYMTTPSIPITELPVWALNAVEAFDKAEIKA